MFRFEGDLKDHLSPPDRTQPELNKLFSTPGSVKDAIESFGIPHTEIGKIIVNQESVGFGYLLQDGDRVTAFGAVNGTLAQSTLRPPLVAEEIRFILDVHLGRLAAYLRMLGFDTEYRTCLSDPEIAGISASEGRVLLTRDRGLLMRSMVTHGYWLRHTDSRLQTEEVLRRYHLTAHIRPWTRCMACNGLLHRVDKQAVLNRIPPRTVELHEEFSRCSDCRRVYWKGSHYARMQRWVEELAEGSQ